MKSLKDLIYDKIRGLRFKEEDGQEDKPVEAGCKHDFAHVEYGDIWRKVSRHTDTHTYTTNREESILWARCYVGFYYVERAENMVCIKCGKCDAGVERFKKAHSLQKIKARLDKRKKRRRDAWAKQLWHDGCKKAE